MSIAPLLQSPLSDLSWIFHPLYYTVPSDPVCTKITMRYMDCLEAYGLHKGREKCAELFFDWSECQKKTFQKNRRNAIRQERMKQYREGKIDKPFDEYPPVDSYFFIN